MRSLLGEHPQNNRGAEAGLQREARDRDQWWYQTGELTEGAARKENIEP